MMNKYRLIVFLGLFLICFTHIIRAQGDSELSKYLPEYSTEESSALYNGVPDITIPLYTLEGKGISIPVSISYDASGNTVQEEASSVGLGWVLNGGGYIVSETRDWYDFAGIERVHTDTMAGIEQRFREEMTSYWTQGDGDFELLHKYDNLPDMYYFNFNGTSGKFFLSNDHTTGICLPASTMKIQYDTTYVDITITTDDGTRYFFNHVQRIMPPNLYIKTESDIYVLESIYTPQYDTIKFTYQSVIYDKSIYESLYDPGYDEFFHVKRGKEMPLNLLKSISTNNGESIEVEFGERRLDCSTGSIDSVPRVKRIKLMDAEGNTKRYFELYQHYFYSDPYLQYLPQPREAEGEYNLKDENGSFVLYDSVGFVGLTGEEYISWGYRNGQGDTIPNHFSRGQYIFTRHNDTVYAVLNDDYLTSNLPEVEEVYDFEYDSTVYPGTYEQAYEDYINYVTVHNNRIEEYLESLNPIIYYPTKTEGGMYYFAVDTSYINEVSAFFGDNGSSQLRPFYYSDQKSLRLRLDSLIEYSGDQTISTPPFTFKYDSTRLPYYLSSDYDHWGYYNYRTGKANLSPVNDDYQCSSIFHECKGSIWPYNGNRSPLESKMKARILEKITYPNGGYVKFNFEANRARSNDSGSQSQIVGGLRLKSKEIGSGNGDSYYTTYDYKEYNDTVINGIYYLDTTGICSGYIYANKVQYESAIGYGWNDDSASIAMLTAIMDNSVYPLLKTGSGYVGYSSVAVKKEDANGNTLGTTLYRFHANEPMEFVNHSRIFFPDFDIYTDYMQYVSAPKPASPLLGTLEEKIVADKWDQILFQTKNQYSETQPYLRELESSSYYKKYIHCYAGSLGGVGLWRAYIDPSEMSSPHTDINPNVAMKTATYNYQYTYDGDVISDSTFYLYDIPYSKHTISNMYEGVYDLTDYELNNYTYDSILDAYSFQTTQDLSLIFECYHTQKPIQELHFEPDGDPIRIRHWYPSHFADNDTVFEKMVDRNMLSPVVKTEKILNGNRIEGKKYDYGIFPGDTIGDEDFLLPAVTHQYHRTGYEKSTEVKSYNSYGFPVEVEANNGNTTSSIRGYNNSRTVAVAENADYSEIRYLGFEEGQPDNWSSYNSGGTISSSAKNTGTQGLSLSSVGCKGIQHTIYVSDLDNSGQYTLSARFKNLDYSSTTSPCVRMVVKHSGGSTLLESISENNGQWNDAEVRINLNNYSNITSIDLYVLNGTTSLASSLYGDVYVDEVRFHPSDAIMTTYTYDPLSGNTSETSPNGITTIYSYDGLGRTTKVEDQQGIILRKTEYHYKGD